MNLISLSIWDIAAVGVFVLLNGFLSLWLSLGIERQLLVATIRMVVQLSAVGAVLTLLFSVATLPGPLPWRSSWCCSPAARSSHVSSAGSPAGGATGSALQP